MQPNAQLRDNAMPHPGLATWTRGSSSSIRLSSYVLTGLLLLLLLISLRCTHFLDPTAEYSRVRKLFERGYLSDTQEAADNGYRWFLNTRPEWASQFLLLEAESMIWRGFNEESLRLLSAQPSTFFSPEGMIQKQTLEAVALTHLDRLP